ncbi:hypothetical protein OS493_020956 [Desmophyllum pertusum]|uniref:Lysozyme n=1 Tax=Desmophyllum pertusum TaxID=174260 RepID=A0A9W9ZZX6_9CNID|nr:hypothetical protein OS493_020956 [Desmophyllum pertusum]
MEKNVIIFLLVGYLALTEATFDMCHCGTSFVHVGCYKDHQNPRLLRHYILNERDPEVTGGNHGDQIIDWANWHDYLPQLICRCATKAKLLGYDVFGIQYYGECWADKMTLLKDQGWLSGNVGEPGDCVGKHFQPCGNTRYCSGKQWRMMVYRIVDMCSIRIEKLGCYKERFSSRPIFPQYILNDRDPQAKTTWSGIFIDWPNWYEHLPDFVCRCAQRIKENGYKWKIFGIRNWGECWSGNVTQETFLLQKVANQDECKNQCFEDCGNNAPFCTGTDFSNAVYAIVENPNQGSG